MSVGRSARLLTWVLVAATTISAVPGTRASPRTTWRETTVRTGSFYACAATSRSIYAATGTQLVVLGADGRVTRKGSTSLCFAGCMASGASGRVYIGGGGCVRVYDSQGWLVRTISSPGNGASQIGATYDEEGSDAPGPKLIAVGPSDRLYVYDQPSRSIKLFSPAGAYLGRWSGRLSAGQSVRGMAVDRQGNVYLSDGAAYCVRKYDPKGRLLLRMGGKGTGVGRFRPEDTEGVGPGSIAVDQTGRVFVVDDGTAKVNVFNSAGVAVDGVRLLGSGSTARAIACGADGSIYVTDGAALRRLRPSRNR
jgi:hypothetical protein